MVLRVLTLTGDGLLGVDVGSNINLWALWCGACGMELEWVNALDTVTVNDGMVDGRRGEERSMGSNPDVGSRGLELDLRALGLSNTRSKCGIPMTHDSRRLVVLTKLMSGLNRPAPHPPRRE